jgi:hypothetical protein
VDYATIEEAHTIPVALEEQYEIRVYSLTNREVQHRLRHNQRKGMQVKILPDNGNHATVIGTGEAVTPPAIAARPPL